MRRVLVCVLALAAAAPLFGDKKKQGPALLLRPGQKVEINGLKPALARERCESWAWAAAVETQLRVQSVALGQADWVTKMYGGELCRFEFAGFESLARVIDGDYVLDDGRKIRLTTKYTVGAPTVPDEMIFPVRGGLPPLLFWKGHPYLVVGLVYDEYVASGGDRQFHIREIRMLDPWYDESAPQRNVTFVRERDNPAEIDGMLIVSATPRE